MNATRRWFAWLQLLRLPNVFTAGADVMMGFLVTHGSLRPVSHFALLAASSCLLYMSGMVLNDVFDAEVDARERPERPIPSGRVARRAAAAVGVALLAGGVLAAIVASYCALDSRAAVIGVLLAICVILYDGALKRTPLGPLAMGACRALNVWLGMSLAAQVEMAAEVASPYVRWGSAVAWLVGLGIGTYIVGVTWFARTEAHASSRWQLAGGTAIMLAGMVMLSAVPPLSGYVPRLRVGTNGWYFLWAALAMITARRCALAIYNPRLHTVQTAVRHCVHSIIVVDAAVCVGYAGPMWGFAVLALLAPTLVLTAWLKAT